MLAQVRDFLTRHGEAALPIGTGPPVIPTPTPQRVINRAGFRRITFETSGKPPEDQQTEFLIFPSVWTGEVCKGFDPAAVARLLIKRCALKPAEDGRPAGLSRCRAKANGACITSPRRYGRASNDTRARGGAGGRRLIRARVAYATCPQHEGGPPESAGPSWPSPLRVIRAARFG
jgi:hypothetical protein